MSLVFQFGDLPLVWTSASPALNWAAVKLVALLGELPHGVGDDFGLIAVDAPGGQRLGDGERVEQGGPTAGRSRGRRCAAGCGRRPR